MEDVIATFEGSRPLDRQHIKRLFDETQARVIAHGIGADGAQRPGADVEAAVTEDDVIPDRDEGRGQGPRLRVWSAQEMIRQPLGGLGTDSRQS
jgi:hypothetical protein